MLGARLQTALVRLAEVLRPGLDQLERRLLKQMAGRGYQARERKALAAVSVLAAARLLAAGRSLDDFLEQADYNGGRLAKLEAPAARIVEELKRCEGVVESWIERVCPGEAPELRWVLRQLSLAVVLALNNAFYRVREAETAALHALFEAELLAQSHRDLTARCLEILASWSQAGAGRLFLRDPKLRAWVEAAAWPPGAPALGWVGAAPAVRRLAKPRYLACRGPAAGLVLDPGWREHFACCWSIPLVRNQRLEGLLQLAFLKPYQWLPRELRLLRAAGERILQAAEKARLSEELAARESQIRRLAEQMVHIEELERQRISRELHDEAGQSLLCLRLQLEMLEARAAAQGLGGPLAEARRLAETTVEEVRRLVADLSPAVLEHLGLPAALRRMVGRFRRLHPIRTRLVMRLQRRIPKRFERVVYRLIQECLNNAGRHSRAAHLNIFLRTDDKGLRIRVEDDGVGFQVPKALAEPKGLGLVGLQERVVLLGGRFQIRSRPGEGARIAIELPLPEPGSDAEADRATPASSPIPEGRAGAITGRKVEIRHAENPHLVGG